MFKILYTLYFFMNMPYDFLGMYVERKGEEYETEQYE